MNGYSQGSGTLGQRAFRAGEVRLDACPVQMFEQKEQTMFRATQRGGVIEEEGHPRHGHGRVLLGILGHGRSHRVFLTDHSQASACSLIICRDVAGVRHAQYRPASRFMDDTPNVWLSGSGGDCTTTMANLLHPLQIAPAFASGEAAVRCNPPIRRAVLLFG